ncbi:MAG: DUF3592 domain-containing protein [Balneolaceae bacterium]|nr:DUF3592 domain-containing protein [Balneolaceae bacterium]MDR9408601.1 DUF3592 domain-containing protein [Balneolaceae bacterium]
MQVILLLIGLLLILIGVFLIWDQLQARLSYEKVLGTITGYRKRMDYKSGDNLRMMFYPIIEYVVQGQKKKLNSTLGSSFPSYDIGESVYIYYSSKNDEAKLKSIAPFYGGMLFLLAGGYLGYIFFATFSFSFFSVLFVLIILTVIFWILFKQLKKFEIKSGSELIERIRNKLAGMSKLREADESELITRQEELLSTDLFVNKNIQYAGPIILLIGFGLIFLAGYFWIEKIEFMEVALSAEGEVVDYEVRGSGEDETFYPIIVFTTKNSKEYEFTHEAGSGTDPYYTVNSTVQVLYDPETPYDAIIDQGAWNWLWPVLISFIALAFFGSGVKMVFQWMKIKRFKEKLKEID